MQDQLLTCANCGNPFVYSVYEQIKANKNTNSTLTVKHADTADSLPIYCPICTSIKASEQKHPPKPKK